MKPGVRVTGGAFRGRGLAVPPGARPTEGRVREALFNALGSMDGVNVTIVPFRLGRRPTEIRARSVVLDDGSSVLDAGALEEDER